MDDSELENFVRFCWKRSFYTEIHNNLFLNCCKKCSPLKPVLQPPLNTFTLKFNLLETFSSCRQILYFKWFFILLLLFNLNWDTFTTFFLPIYEVLNHFEKLLIELFSEFRDLKTIHYGNNRGRGYVKCHYQKNVLYEWPSRLHFHINS